MMIYERFYLDKTLFFNWINGRAVCEWPNERRIFRGIILAFRFGLRTRIWLSVRCFSCALCIFRGFLFTFVCFCCVQFWFSTKSSVIVHKRSLILIISWHLVIDTFRSPFFINFLFLCGLQCCAWGWLAFGLIKYQQQSNLLHFGFHAARTLQAADFFLLLFKVRPAHFDIVTELTKPDENNKPKRHWYNNVNDGRRL